MNIAGIFVTVVVIIFWVVVINFLLRKFGKGKS